MPSSSLLPVPCWYLFSIRVEVRIRISIRIDNRVRSGIRFRGRSSRSGSSSTSSPSSSGRRSRRRRSVVVVAVVAGSRRGGGGIIQILWILVENESATVDMPVRIKRKLVKSNAATFLPEGSCDLSQNLWSEAVSNL